jgi:pteridine reductase
MELKGKTAFVTGAAKRIGGSIALAFAQEGCDLLLHVHTSKDEAVKTSEEIKKMGVSCQILEGDFSDESGVKSFLNQYSTPLKKASVFINSHSIFYPTPLHQVTLTQWQKFINTNLSGPFFLSQGISGSWKEDGRDGVMIHITDTQTNKPPANFTPYMTSKAALEGLVRSLAAELSPHIRVNAVAPGVILFPDGYGEKEKKAVIDRVALKKAGSTKDIAAACVFLAKNDYINGFTLRVDGGR